MAFFRRYGNWLANIAWMAVLFASIAPTLSHALAAGQQAQTVWMQVCGDEAAHVALDTSHANHTPDAPPNHFDASMGHCPYCANHAAAWAIPHDERTLADAPRLSHERPTLYYHAPRPLFAWASTQPRAPPAAVQGNA